MGTVLYWWLFSSFSLVCYYMLYIDYVTELVRYRCDHAVTNLEMMNKMEMVGISY